MKLGGSLGSCFSAFAICVAGGCAHDPPSFTGVDAASGLEITLRSDFTLERDFSGTYESPYLGTLELRQEKGAHLTGTFSQQIDGYSVRGALAGRVRGNLATFDWWEMGRSPTRVRGAGFFLYDPARGGGPVRLFGARRVLTREFPLTDDESFNWLSSHMRGEPWTAVGHPTARVQETR